MTRYGSNKPTYTGPITIIYNVLVHMLNDGVPTK